MTPTEAAQIMRVLLTYFDGAGRQPDWGDASTMPAWIAELSPFPAAWGLEVLNDLRDEWQAINARGEPVFFPRLVEFSSKLRTLAATHEREDYERQALDAAIRCDGSRWIDNGANAAGVRPFPSLRDGMVPCPTCSPAQHAHALSYDVHSRMETKGAQPSPPPCRRHTSIEELPATAEQATKHIEEARRVVVEMSPQSPLRQALEKGWQ